MNIELEILQASYWEHFKFAKDLSLYLPIDDKKRINIEKEMNDLITKINLKKENYEKNVCWLNVSLGIM